MYPIKDYIVRSQRVYSDVYKYVFLHVCLYCQCIEYILYVHVLL